LGIDDFVICFRSCGNVVLLSIIYLSHYEKKLRSHCVI